MNISLTPKLEGFVRAKVKTGGYNNASEVVREALRLLQREEEDIRERKVARLRRALRAGLMVRTSTTSISRKW
jgi:antitoxin ParD1/3/4